MVGAMRSQRIKQHWLLTTAAAAALLLAAAGAARRRPRRPATPRPPPASSREPAGRPRRPPPATASSLPPRRRRPRPAGPALCKAAGLTATTDATGGGAAGSVYMQLILTNSGTEPCLLKGFAGVSLTAGADGEPIGAAATRDDSTPATDVMLAPGKAGAATLRYTQAANYPDCTRTPAAGFRVYPPNDTASLFIAAAHWTPAPTRTSTC